MYKVEYLLVAYYWVISSILFAAIFYVQNWREMKTLLMFDAWVNIENGLENVGED